MVGVKPDDKIVLIGAAEGTDYELAKSRKAVEYISRLFRNVTLHRYKVNISALPHLTSDLAQECQDFESVIAILTGGMRLLILLVASALLVLRRVRGTNILLVGGREDGLLYTEITPEYLDIPDVTQREFEVLDYLIKNGGRAKRSVLVRYFIEKWGATHVVVYRRLRNMEGKSLIRTDNSIVEATPLGMALARVFQVEG
jgi:hypothetical protein